MLDESMKNYLKERVVNIVLDNEDVEEDQLYRSMYSMVGQKNVIINVIGLKNEKVKSGFKSCFLFDENFENNIKIYQSPKIVLTKDNIYSIIKENPKTGFKTALLDKVNQRFWPKIPEIKEELPEHDKVIRTDFTEVYEEERCLFQD